MKKPRKFTVNANIRWSGSRGQHMIAFPHVVAAETKELRHVHDQIAVRVNRT